MVSMMAIFVALVLNRISTPFQRMFYFFLVTRCFGV